VALRVCAVSIDLDEIGAYRAIHGLPARPEGSGAVYRLALQRIASFARHRRLTPTLFAVGRDLERSGNRERLLELVRAGAEIENHSYSHPYALTRQGRSSMRDEVARAQREIEALSGRRPQCFRAPGYTVSDALFDVLEEEHIPFDSSVLPSPPYYLAKLAALAMVRLAGRRSGAIATSPAALRAPVTPYRPGHPWYRRGGRRLIELPITVGAFARVPIIGTALTLAGAAGARRLVGSVIGRELVNLELHGIDFLDATDGLCDLRARQPDVRVPLARKLARLSGALDVLERAGYRFTTLVEAAGRVIHSL